MDDDKKIKVIFTKSPRWPTVYSQLLALELGPLPPPEAQKEGKRRRRPHTRILSIINGRTAQTLCATFLANDSQETSKTVNVSSLLYCYLKTGLFKQRPSMGVVISI